MNESMPIWDNLGKKSMEQGPEEGRSIDEYEKVLKFKREDLENKFVLDLCAGPKARFSRDLEESGVKATVVSLSPEYADEQQCKLFEPTFLDKFKMIIKNKKSEHLEVAGVGEQLPFKDESFDEVLSLFSVSTWSLRNYKFWIPEICRVLKPNGAARIGPFKSPKLGPDESLEKWDKSKKWREDYIEGLGYKYEYFPGTLAREEILIISRPDADQSSKI